MKERKIEKKISKSKKKTGEITKQKRDRPGRKRAEHVLNLS